MRQLLRDRNLRMFVDRHRAMVGLLCGILTLVFVVGSIARQAAQNRRAIRVSCVLLNNAIAQSSTDPTAPLLIGEIVRLAVEHHHRVFIVRYTEISRHPHPLRAIDCERVASDPGSVRAIPVAMSIMGTTLDYGGHG